MQQQINVHLLVINKLWDSRLFGAIFSIFSLCYLIGYRIKQKFFSNRRVLPTPLIVVGNAVVGGTGKTPFVIWLIKLLQQKGIRVAAITRGYKRQFHSEIPLVFEYEYPCEFLGDEAALIGEECLVPIGVGDDRYETAKKLMDNYPDIQAVISDDGLQYMNWQADLSIALLGDEDAIGNGCLLPAGRLRAPLSDLIACDYILSSFGSQPGYVRRLSLSVFHPTSSQHIFIGDLPQDVAKVLFTGIANPQMLLENLQKLIDVKLVRLADHENISLGLLNCYLKEQIVLMTAKDIIKIKHNTDAMSHPNLYVVMMDFDVDPYVAEQILGDVKRICEL